MISYGQNFEDVLLARVFKGRSKGFYIDIGAMDPVEGSITKHFYDLGWSGINIEPDERFYDKLRLARPRDLNLCIAVGDTQEDRTFYQFEAQGLSTLSTENFRYFADKHFPYRELTVAVTTLADICRSYVHGPIDFLKIDAEGWEAAIIRGADWQCFRPLVLVIESTKPYSYIPTWHEWEPVLLEAGYRFTYSDGVNRYYVREESSELAACFEFPPNVLDNFQPYETVRLHNLHAAALAETEALTIQLAEARDQLAKALTEKDVERLRMDELRQKMDALQAEYQKAVERADAESAQNQSLLGRLKELELRCEEMDELRQKMDALQVEYQKAVERADAESAENQSLQGRLKELELRCEELIRQRHSAEKQVRSAESRLSAIQQDFEELRKANSLLAEQLGKEQDRLQTALAETRRLTARVGKVSQDKAALTLRISELQHHLSALQGAAAALNEMYTEPLSDATHDAIRVEVIRCAPQLRVGESTRVVVRVENCTPEHLLSIGRSPVHLSYHWLDPATGAVEVFEGERTPLALPVRRYSSRQMEMKVKAPDKAGTYLLRTCAVQESVRWFDHVASGGHPIIEVCDHQVS